MVWVSGDEAAEVAVRVFLVFLTKAVVCVSPELSSELIRVAIKALEAVSVLRV